ncbi:proton-conducting transporter membrane subunit [Pyrobaculum neutrophilum]|uniref:NADH/Ubiquinone/plastoquinone (Complex I) n=1 Tax=Pyrobaculum neutrophilum (strain DSM 2338 / JCM 9278 / NBRC 100436 / V24Sta) TaxID=444157 RepID=B1YB16_PYRNV|nr:proton-conducting transporter membrane subunit [Pyrobaculum neutrophilum]ACB40716.1 NADH/Ubiquinone/plastoquinone (complex I) [Pyrobaculum neutrophilum V24Sta]
MAGIELILPVYFAARVAAGFGRWGAAVDVAYVALLAFLMWQISPLYLLSLPFYLAAAAVGGGVFRDYAGFASALSLTGVYLMFLPAAYLKGLGFVLAVLAPAALAATARDRGSLEGFFRYMVVSVFASSFLFIGLGQRGAPVGEAYILLAIALELGVAPMFLWVPDVYGRTNAVGLAILASLPKLSAAFALLAFMPKAPALLAHVLGALSMATGNLGALTSADARRILAYSTVAHSGFALFIYPASPEVALALVLADSFGKMGLFYALGSGGPRWAARVLALHQIGLPPLFGFWPKALLVLLTAERVGPLFALYVLVNVVAVAPYYFRLMESIPEGRSAFPAAVGVAVAALGAAAPLWLIYNVSSLL